MQCTNAFYSSTIHHLPLQKLSTLRANQPLAEEQNRTHKRGKASVESNPKLITSTSNPFVKHCVKLRQSSSYRHSHGSALVVGTTPIRSLLASIPSLLSFFFLCWPGGWGGVGLVNFVPLLCPCFCLFEVICGMGISFGSLRSDYVINVGNLLSVKACFGK